jgi:sugar lactone lactonase YvrE
MRVQESGVCWIPRVETRHAGPATLEGNAICGRERTMREDVIRFVPRPPVAICFLMAVVVGSLCRSSVSAAGEPGDVNSAPDVNAPAYWWQWTGAEPNHPDLTGVVYWTDKDRGLIQRQFLAGGPAMTLLTADQGVRQPYGLAIDRLRNRFYWADAGTGTIYSARLDGTDIRTLVTGLTFPADLALHATAGRLYWTDQTAGVIQRLDLEQGEVETILTNLSSPYYLALDIRAGMIYWTEFRNSIIHRARWDGTDPQIIVRGLQRARDIAVDPMARKLYWADRDAAKIQREDLDEQGPVEDLFTSADGLMRPHGMVLDPFRRRIYWTDTDRPGVYCGSMDGGDVRTLATEGLDGPWGIGLITATPDLDMDADVDWLDWCDFARYWLDEPASWTTAWCAGRDLNADGAIDLRDFSRFAGSWVP